MTSSTVKAMGVREFRDHLSESLMSDVPIVITKHGLTIGYYIPAHHTITVGDREALARTARTLHELLEAEGIDPEEIIREAKEQRDRAKRPSRD